MKKILIIAIIFLSNTLIHAQRMQLSSIPGVDSGMDIDSMLKQIMAPYHNQITNLNNQRRNKEIETALWTDFRTNIDNFDRINRYIFSYESAFRDKTNKTSVPDLLDISTDRTAKNSIYNIKIKKLAQADVFSSGPVPQDLCLSESIFSVKSGSAEQTIAFKGGNISDLMELLRDSLQNTIDVELINTSPNTRSILLRSKKTGKNNKITFNGDLTSLKEAKLLSDGTNYNIDLYWQESQEKTTIKDQTLDKIFNTTIPDNAVLTFKADVTIYQTPKTLELTERPSLQSLSVTNINTVSNEIIILPSVAPILRDFSIEETQQTHQEKIPEQLLILHFDDGNNEKIILNTNIYNISLEQHAGKTLTKASVVSENADTTIYNMKISCSHEGSLTPYNIISEGRDALFSFNGVELERPENSISDILEGVTFDLLQESDTNIIVSIGPNLELIEETIIQWVLAYNTLMEEINIFTTIPIEKIGKIKPLYKREQDGDDLKEGSFYGNGSLLSYRDALRRLSGVPHNNDPNSLSLLDQIGIYVKRLQSNASIDRDAVRKGILTVDSAQLKKALNENFDAVKKMFAYDSNGDNIADMGLSVSAAKADELMIGGNGYLARMNRESIDKLKELDQKIAKKQDELETTERKERQALLKMSQAIAASKAQNESLKQRFGN
ncbi:Flagellar capping protein FliD [Brevinema andersonii]|uniref:Flagellar hook-associated protein 2 n=1 Tax=Brevinema andersonii TaxID=34097 RepID=A0A1I1DWX1_BREAD|nr:flagellar filament capping protein FliD [Brevinema andersonii]SFB77210.1 Flagellar capping protein FliD [Brevinema andersonii]